jgi:NAD(P)-dependent dehydrogenase (short-subunit alcohol dehydrogenase family)
MDFQEPTRPVVGYEAAAHAPGRAGGRSVAEITSVLITGANAGIGRELARQLGGRPEITRVSLGVRNRERGLRARDELRAETGRSVFEVVMIDVADVRSARSAAAAVSDPVDAVVMNAGGLGGKDPAARTVDGVTQIFAANVLGHAALLDGLIEQEKLASVAVLVGSEAARGVRRLRIPRPNFRTNSVEELASVIDGSYYDGTKFNAMAAYAHVKYIGALWMGSMARRHPELRFVTMSPGGTRGTNAASDLNPVMRFVYDRLIMGAMAKNITHGVDVGSARLLAAVEDPSYNHGEFYGSAADTLTGPVIKQATIFPDIANETFQNNATEAIHRFLRST